MEKIFYIHVPKNAGTTLNQIIAKNYRRVCRLSWNKDEADYYGNLLRGAKGEAVFDDCDVIRGHFPYGLHQLLDPGTKFRYMTMLRDPIKRTVSAFNYLRQDSTYVNDHPEVKAYISKLSISDFLSCFHDVIPGHVYADNAQVRYLSGAGDSKAFGHLEICDLEAAKKNLAGMLFGLAEDFNRSMLYFKRELPLKNILYANRKVGSVVATQLSALEENQILERNEMDLELYRFGRQLFRERTGFVTSEMLDDYDSKLKIYRYFDHARTGVARLARDLIAAGQR